MTRASLLLAAALVAGCDRGPAPAVEEPPVVRVMRIGAAQAAQGIEFAGEVRARHEAPIGFRVGGKVVERPVQAGQRVAAGDTIARLDPADLALAADAARAQRTTLESDLDLAARELERYKGLREKNFVSQAELERRQNAYASARAQLDAARARLDQAANQHTYATLVADAAGVITAVDVEVGQVVAAGQTVARLALPGAKEVVIAVPESLRAAVAASRGFVVAANALPGRSWKGTLRELSPSADPATRTYAARITIADAGEELALGMSARVGTAAVPTAGVSVPLTAVHSRGEQPQVWLVDAQGTVRSRAVVTRGFAGDRMVVEQGLQAGDVVVVAGAQLLRAGQKVRVQEK
jgi:multidrug efflux system membrane fusion protein